tara:strand:+ start:1754 stop:2344 length:591 start_codon:yes stop_codon:yes gene_type:complete
MNFIKKKYFCFLLFLIQILLSQNIDEWNILEEGSVWVGWKYENNFPICMSKKSINAPMNAIIDILENLGSYDQVFDRVELSLLLDSSIVYIALEMPFPFSGRDYIVKYSKNIKENEIIYSFNSITRKDAPIKEDYIRLINAHGKWTLKEISNNKTEVKYSWNGELLGEFPDWALTRAWLTQGKEVLEWLEIAVNPK